jgi:energy-converting hydrogenase B subunit D
VNGSTALADYLIALALLLVTVCATAAALTREPVRQAMVLALLGLSLALLFTVLQAPDVAMSQLAVGGALTPLLIVLTVRKVRRDAESAARRGSSPSADSAERSGEGDGTP